MISTFVKPHLLVMIGALCLAGCGGGDSVESTDSATASAVALTPGASASAPNAANAVPVIATTGRATAQAVTATLSASVSTTSTPASLTSVGTADWAHWGNGGVPGLVRKASGGGQIGAYALVAGGNPVSFTNSPRAVSWSDGMPTASVGSNRNGLYLPGGGYSVTVPAGTGVRTVTMYVGGWNSGGTFTAHLSDGSTADYVDTSAAATGQWVRTYTVAYQAANDNQTLTLTWVRSSGTGNIDLNAVALSSAAVAANQAPVLTAPSAQVAMTGQAARLALSATDPNGDALTYTANGLPAGLAIDAATGVISGVPTTAGNYTVALAVSDGRGGTAAASFGWLIQAAGTGSLGLTIGTTTASANLSSVGTSDWVHWGDGAVPGATRKATGGNQIGAYATLLGGTPSTYGNDPRPLAWTDGASITSDGANRKGVYIAGQNNGFSVSVPAGAATRTVTAYVGGWASSGTFRARLSDGSATDVTDAVALQPGQYVRAYTIVYAARTEGQQLTMSWTQASTSGNVTLNAVALGLPGTLPSNRVPVIAAPSAQTGTQGQAATLAMVASDPDGDPLTFSATGLPAGLSIATSTGMISGTPTTVASYAPVVTVADGKGGSAVASFGWSIQATVPAPLAGLDTRPNNTTCLAPARPQNSTGFQLGRVFPNLMFNLPVGMYQPPLDSSRWYVIEQQSGLVRSFPNNQGATAAQVTTFLNLSSRIQPDDEMGLLGLAFHPQWPATPQVFVYYSVAGTSPVENRVSRFTSSNGGASLDLASEQVILRIVKNQADTNHNGGNIAFGPDGFLYIGTGDGGGGGDPNNNAQNPNVLLGKMLRIDVSPASGYAIPSGSAGNPYAANPKCVAGSGSAACPEIFATGLRNPWRWSFDRSTGDLWVGDVGQDNREEIDIVKRGANYGWRLREGSVCYSPSANCGTTGASGDALIDPVVEYGRDVGQAVTGGYVYRGSKVPGLVGRYVFADYVSSRMFSFQPPNPLVAATPRVVLKTTDAALTANQNVTSMAQGNDGELYVIGYGGELYGVQPAGVTVDTIPTLLSQTGCVAANATQPASGLVPFAVNAPFWSDSADKQRWLALPNGTTMAPQTPGSWTLPNGTVLMKNFKLNNQLIETRLLMRHPDGVWAGYTYEWNAAQTDATRVKGGKTKTVGTQTWIYPSENDCLQCHTQVAGRTLSLETAQLNGNLTYPQTGRTANQITTLNAVAMLSPTIAGAPATLPAYVDPHGAAGTVEQRARAFLHANCSQCHQPNGPTPVSLDLRYSTPLAQTGTCNVTPTSGGLGLTNAKVIAPGLPDSSVLLSRVNRRDSFGMPPLGSSVVDTASVAVLRQWIQGLTGCQ